jgi:hypothetical protein
MMLVNSASILLRLPQNKFRFAPSPNMAKEIVANDGDVDPLDTIEEHEYPSGLRLASIVTALVLSIFLASLDTVR